MKNIFLIIMLMFNYAYGQPDLKRGLVAYFPFNGNTKDESGNKHHATPSNIVYTSDRHGNSGSACYFNGTNAFAELPKHKSYNFSDNSNFSISVWISPDAGNKWPAQAIIVKSPPHYDFTQSVWDYGVYLLNYRGMSGFGYNHILNGKSIFNSKTCWYNIIITYSSGVWKMYINGLEESSSAYRRNTITHDPESVLVFGKKGASDGDYFKGKMDDARIYNRILTKEEINLLAANPCFKPDCSVEKVSANFSFDISNCNNANFKLQGHNHRLFSDVKWFFGDGSNSRKKSPVHFYKKPGAYTVSAITTSKNGCLDTFSRQVNIKFLKTDFVVSEEDAPGEILFKAKANGPRYTWNLGDSSVINNETIVRHTYRSSGEYTAMLFAENNSGCKDTVVHQLRIDLPPNDLPDAPLQQYEVTQVAEDAVQPIIENRETDIVRSLDINEDSVQIAIYDNGVIDGDSITLIYDGMIILSRQVLKREPLLLKLAVGSMQETHLLKMYAENLGTIPPNTALMVIRDGENRHDIYVSSNATSNGSVLFRRRR